MKVKTTSVVNVPNLRFPGFEGEWVEKKLGEICEIKTGSQDTQDKNSEGKYPFFVRSNTVERIDKYLYDGEAILTSGDGVGVGKNFHYINGKFGFHQRVYSLRKFQKECYGKFIYSVFSEKFYRRVMRLSAKNSVDSVRMDMISKMPFYFPLLEEQKKIASFLFLIEERISTQSEIIEDYKLLKKGMMQKIFQQELRFKNEEGSFYPKWEEKKANKIFKNCTNKSHNGDLPILSASQKEGMIYRQESGIKIQSSTKSIKSYKVVEPNDFVITLRSFQGGIDFSDKKGICSPAYTILKNSIPVNYSFYKFYFKKERFINRLSKTTIGIRDGKQITYENFGNLMIPYPTLLEQQKIASTLSAIDSKITLESAYLDKLKAQKKYLLQNMFV